MTDMTGVIGKRRFSAPSPAFQPKRMGCFGSERAHPYQGSGRKPNDKILFDCFSGTGRSVHVYDEP